jgi:hypothetical protein
MNSSNIFASPQLLVSSKNAIIHYGQRFFAIYMKDYDISLTNPTPYLERITKVPQPIEAQIYNYDNTLLSSPLGSCLPTESLGVHCVGLIDDSTFALASIWPKESSFYVPLVGFPLLSNPTIAKFEPYLTIGDDRILLFGGSTLGNGTKTDSNLYLIDPISYTWKIIPTTTLAPPPRRGACLVQIKGSSFPDLNMLEFHDSLLLLFGESENNTGDKIFHNEVWRSEIREDSISWELLPFHMPHRSSGQTCKLINQKGSLRDRPGVKERECG